MFKITSVSNPRSEDLGLFLTGNPVDHILQEAISLISDNLGTKDVPVERHLRGAF